MFLAPVRVLEVSPPRPRKKERRIASHRVSPPTSRLLLFPAPSSSLLRRLASSYVVYRGWNRRENINFSVPRPTYASFPLPLLLLLFLFRDPSRPWDFLGHGSVIWCPTDDRSLTQPRSIARIFDHGAFRAFRLGTRRERPFFRPSAPSVPWC